MNKQLIVRTVTPVSESKVRKAMKALRITAELDLEAGEGADYDYAELRNDGAIEWSTDGSSDERAKARAFFDKVWG